MATLFANLFLFLSLPLACIGETGLSEVPILIWTDNTKNGYGDLSHYFEPVSAASRLNEYNFKEQYAQKLFSSAFIGGESSTVIIFMQDYLSVEDFTKYGNAYGSRSTPPAYRYLKGVVGGSESSSVFLPSVSNGGDIVEQIAQDAAATSDWHLVTLKAAQHYRLDGVHLTAAAAKRHVILVYLPPTDSAPTVEESRRRNDDIVRKVIEEVKSQQVEQYVAVFTGLKPSHVIQYVAHDRLRRQINEDASNTSVAINFKNCTLFYSKQIMFNVLQMNKAKAREELVKSVKLKNELMMVDEEKSQCYNKSTVGSKAILCLTYNDQSGEDKIDLTLTLEFPVSQSGEWSLPVFRMDYDCTIVASGGGGAGNQTFRMQKDNDTVLSGWGAPSRFSYHCDDTGSVGGKQLGNASEELRRAALQFHGLQVQPSVGQTGGKFGRGYDCQTFFTPGILMGIVVGALLIWIFMYGMAMMMGLRTMDRFDDPKGKTITVPSASATD